MTEVKLPSRTRAALRRYVATTQTNFRDAEQALATHREADEAHNREQENPAAMAPWSEASKEAKSQRDIAAASWTYAKEYERYLLGKRVEVPDAQLYGFSAVEPHAEADRYAGQIRAAMDKKVSK